MKKNTPVLILGDGRVARAVYFYLKSNAPSLVIDFYPAKKNIKDSGLLIGALPGDLGRLPLELALRHKKDLIDISDTEAGFYIKHKKEIERKGVTVIPCCGFCPGLVNFIIGRELRGVKNIKSIEVKAGSLSPLKNYYPFLWCIEDLVLCHRLSSYQLIRGEKKRFPAFGGYRKERVFGIDAESYYTQSGFENMTRGLNVLNFTYRVLRPLGFKEFFLFLEKQGFFYKDTLAVTKAIVEKGVKDNITLSEISITSGKTRIIWKMKSFSSSREKLNSMQKITAVTPAVMARELIKGNIPYKGLLFMEQLGKDKRLFDMLIKENREEIAVTRSVKDIARITTNFSSRRKLSNCHE